MRKVCVLLQQNIFTILAHFFDKKILGRYSRVLCHVTEFELFMKMMVSVLTTDFFFMNLRTLKLPILIKLQVNYEFQS